jgi:stage II sporulation protein D
MIYYNHPPEVKVGILTAQKIRIHLNGIYASDDGNSELKGAISLEYADGRIQLYAENGKSGGYEELNLKPSNPENASFRIFDVVIGIGFHWQRNEDQVFNGSLKIIPVSDGILVINILPVEDYLVSVISSEMKATSSPEMLKAHAVISRSWLLAQIEKGNELRIKGSEYQTSFHTGDEIIRWYDREDHTGFDVCADDHCQRYQGITRAFNRQVADVVLSTGGEVLLFNNSLCDARFSKCCGGITERFENTWEPVEHPYLQRIYDNDDPSDISDDLTVEENARTWILTSPPSFCNTTDKNILSQVLNDYDQGTQNFYRWSVSYPSDELSSLVLKKTGIDFGTILGLEPLERGVSGRLIRLRIKGTKKSMIIGKELEIRKALSPTHLYSSAFVIDKIVTDGRTIFKLHGAGWGHGVGLCQIGAAVMGAKGYAYDEILRHYFRGAEVKKVY